MVVPDFFFEKLHLSKMAKTLCEIHYEIKYENNH